MTIYLIGFYPIVTIYDISETNTYDFILFKKNSISWNVFKENELEITLEITLEIALEITLEITLVSNKEVEELFLYLDIVDIQSFLLIFLPIPNFDL